MLPISGAQYDAMEESILEYVQRRLREVGSAQWEQVAQDAKVSKVLPRKLAYERTNPGVNTVEPLYRYFKDVDAGKRRLPWDRRKTARAQ